MKTIANYYLPLLILLFPLFSSQKTSAQCMQNNGSIVINSITQSGSNCTYNVTFSINTASNSVKWITFTFGGTQVCYRYQGGWVFAPTCTGTGANAGNGTLFTYTSNFTIPCTQDPTPSWTAGRNTNFGSQCDQGTVDFGPLPVNIRYFSGIETELGALVSWGTEEETGLHEFELQKSPDAISFEAAARFKAKGDGDYEYLDKDPIRPNTYYRIKSLDLNGQTSLSKIVNVPIDSQSDFNLYPNPINNNSFVLEGIESVKQLKLYDLQGNLVDFEAFNLNGKWTIFTMPKSSQIKEIFLSVKNTKGQMLSRKIILN